MISFDEFLKQDETDKYNMLQECNAIIQQKENIIKEVREYIEKHIAMLKSGDALVIMNIDELLEILVKEKK